MSRPREPIALVSGGPLPHFACLPVSAELLKLALTGFEIPSLPALAPERAQQFQGLLAEVLYRFQLFILGFQDSEARRSLALQVMADPDQAILGSKVRLYVLCRSSHQDGEQAVLDVKAMARQAEQSLPNDGVFYYGKPHWLDENDLARTGFRNGDHVWPGVKLVELRKFEDRQSWSAQPALQYVPHPLWADQQQDPWIHLIEILSGMTEPTAIRIELTPASLTRASGLDAVGGVGQWFSSMGADLDRRSSQGEAGRKDGAITSESLRAEEVSNALASSANGNYVQRGRQVYKQLIANAGRLFAMRVLLAWLGPEPKSLIEGMRAALCSPPASDPMAGLGWERPVKVAPSAEDLEEAQNNLKYLLPTRWGRSPTSPALGPKIDLRSIVTPAEAVSLFHLPIYRELGQTSALSTADSPFVIPVESLYRQRFKADEKRVQIGYLFQRQTRLDPDSDGQGGKSFYVSVDDLMKPSLLVGAPGSGKSNLAFSLLIQLWRDCGVPFLVLDPSTGNEYRRLLAEPKLKETMVVYTLGDKDVFPLQFNPFSVPPGVTVRNHTTRILASFRAAYPMPDGPISAVYEGALERLYINERYCGEGRAMAMESKGALESGAPTLSDFARAIQDELSEKILGVYKGSGESIGIVRGASTIRVNAIGNRMGHILNVPSNSGNFFQALLQRPAVIELGALGDSTSISLVMAFLISQLTGHIEFAATQIPHRRHVMLIEEAHRLLARGDAESVSGKSAEDLNQMLAEVRKFGQGIMILDQRPSSLVGGVMDNAFVKILTRLSDREGFARLSDELNLNDAQKRYAHTRLDKGQAIVLDHHAGQPVLVQSEHILHERFPVGEERLQFKRNAPGPLDPPPSVPYAELAPQDKPPSATPIAAQAAPVSAVPSPGKTYEWLMAELGTALQSWMENMQAMEHVRNAAAWANSDLEGAKAAVSEALEPAHPSFEDLLSGFWEKVNWAVLGMVAEKDHASKEVIERIRALAVADKANGQMKPAPPPIRMMAEMWLQDDVPRLASRLILELQKMATDEALSTAVKQKILQPAPDLNAAMGLVTAHMEADRAEFNRWTSWLWTNLKWSVIGLIATQRGKDEVVNEVKKRKTGMKAAGRN